MLDRTIAPPIVPITHVAIAEATATKLSNGVPVYYCMAGTQPVVKLELVFQAGAVTASKASLASFAAGMLSEGTISKSSAEISNLVAFYGAELDCQATGDRAIVTLYALKKHLPNLLPLLREIITEAAFYPEEVDKNRTIRLRNLEVQQQKTSYLASSAISKVLYGEAHPYGRVITAEDLNAISRDELAAFYEARYKQSKPDESLFEVIASGLIDEEVLAMLDEQLGTLGTANDTTELPTINLSPSAEKNHLIPFDGTQSTIRVAAHTIGMNHPDIYKLVVLKEALGGYFGSRLMKNVREDKGYTYGIYAQLIHGKLGSRLLIGTDVGIEVTTVALQEIYLEMQKLIDEPMPADELSLVKGALMGSLAGNVTTPFSLADCFKVVHFGNTGYDYFKNLMEAVQHITPQEIQETAAKYLQKDLFYEVVAGGKS